MITRKEVFSAFSNNAVASQQISYYLFGFILIYRNTRIYDESYFRTMKP